jgi:hypothetical protein
MGQCRGKSINIAPENQLAPLSKPKKKETRIALRQQVKKKCAQRNREKKNTAGEMPVSNLQRTYAQRPFLQLRDLKGKNGAIAQEKPEKRLRGGLHTRKRYKS